uniref:Uncharacterized protein n=1 Tax=Panagrolaimus sp. JU765 TaxID=591449 RepID=A0AC34RSR4_9BILA
MAKKEEILSQYIKLLQVFYSLTLFGLTVEANELYTVILQVSYCLHQKKIDQSIFDYMYNFGSYMKCVLESILNEKSATKIEKPECYDALKLFNMKAALHIWSNYDLKNMKNMTNLLSNLSSLIDKFMDIQIKKFEDEKDPNINVFVQLKEAGELSKQK